MRRQSWEPAVGMPGEIVTASVGNPIENPTSAGKTRPAVLVRRDGSRWFVMGLTTKPTYRSGAPRTPVPDPDAVGLNGPGFLWGNRLTGISVLDVDQHLGWVDPGLAATIILAATLAPRDAAALVRALDPMGEAA